MMSILQRSENKGVDTILFEAKYDDIEVTIRDISDAGSLHYSSIQIQSRTVPCC